MKTRALYQLAAIVAVLLSALFTLQAGFQFPGGWDGHTLGDGTASAENAAATAPAKAKLGALINQRRAAQVPPLPPLAGQDLIDAQNAAFDAVRCNVMQMTEIIACQLQQTHGDAAAKCARDALAKGRVCIDFGSAGQGGQWGDTTPAWEKDLININIDLIPLEKVPPYHPLFWRRLLTLYEEMRHAMQDWSATAGGLAGREWAAVQHKAVCNERDVDDEQIALDEAACIGLARILSGAPHGQTAPLVKKVLDKIAALPAGPVRSGAAAVLKGSVMADLAFHRDTRACYDAAKIALDRYIHDPTMTEAQIRAALRAIRWQIPGQTAPPAQPMIGHMSTSTSGDVREIIEEVTTQIPTGLTSVSDIRYDRTGRFILAAGTVGGGLGSIVLLHDANGDGRFAGALPEIIIAPTAVLGQGMSFVTGPPDAPFMVFDPISGVLRELLLPDVRGIPTVLGPAVSSPSPFLDRVCTVRFGSDGRLYGFETQPYDGNYAPNMPVTALTDSDGDLFYDEVASEPPLTRLQFRPAPFHFPHGNQNLLTVHSMTPATLLIHPLDPTGLRLPPIGNTFLPPGLDVATLTVSRPLVPGEYLVLHDPGRNLASVPFRVLPPSLAAWRQQHFGPAVNNPALEATVWGHFADPDNDGARNILELGHGTSPVNATQIPLVTLTQSPAGPVFSYARRPLDPDITYVPQISPSLIDFQHTLLDEITITPLPGGMEQVGILHPPGNSLGRDFFRSLVRPDGPPGGNQ